MRHDNEAEPTVKRESLPLVTFDASGAPCWYVAGSQPPRWERDAQLEALWRDATTAVYWRRVHHRDPRARAMADRHYSRRTPGAAEFLPAGHKIVLMHFTEDGTPVALWASHRPAPNAGLARPRFDGLDVWDCAIFRVERRTAPASVLIREAVAITRGLWSELPRDGFYTTVDPRHVQPIRRRGRDVWGYSYIRAGWDVMPARTKVRGLVQLRLPVSRLVTVAPRYATFEIEQMAMEFTA